MVPAASPAASPTTTGRPSKPARPRGCVAERVDVDAPPHALTTIATAASRKKIPTMSLRASPAWSDSTGKLSAIAPSASDHGATLYGLPMHQHANRQPDKPAEIQQRRKQIPPERQHPRRVEQFRVRRVEPGQELRRDEVQIPRVPALEETGGERPVVPGRIEPGHPRQSASPSGPTPNLTSAARRSPGEDRSSGPRGRAGAPLRRSGVLFFAPTPSSDGR